MSRHSSEHTRDLCRRLCATPDRSDLHHVKGNLFISSYFYLMIIFLAFLPGSIAFSPVWIGSECEFCLSTLYQRLVVPVKDTSFVSPEENEKLQSVCGRANTGEHPWAVSIIFHVSYTLIMYSLIMIKGNNRLGGAIISPYHILTVAHGFMKFSTGAGADCM